MVVKKNAVRAHLLGRLVCLMLAFEAPAVWADLLDGASLRLDRQLSSGVSLDGEQETRPVLLAAADANQTGSRAALFDDVDDALLKTDTNGESIEKGERQAG